MNLTTTRAKDVMEKDVVQLHTLTPIQAALETFEEYSIHGAPVVDEGGELVGVLSAMDIARNRTEEKDQIKRPPYYANDPFDDELQIVDEDFTAELLGRELVGDWMTTNVISVEPDAQLAEVCRKMAQERIHRVFVVEDDQIRGVISTFDIVRCLAGQGVAVTK